MRVRARAPGKLVVLGEYAVMDGAPALVMAVDRYCRAEIEPLAAGGCVLETRSPDPAQYRFDAGAASGVALVDLVAAAQPAAGAWCGRLDSSALYAGGAKLGLGSSAAALTAWFRAWTAWRAGPDGLPPAASVDALIALHRRFQGGAGSGLDVAASLSGGVIEYRLEAGAAARVGSVRWPNSVGFAGIFSGRSASTPDLVGRYRAWGREQPAAQAGFRRSLGGMAESGAAAAREGDAGGLLDAVAGYGALLAALGDAIGADIVTAEHLAIGRLADRFGVVYKISGAGGGDLGLALAEDSDRLSAFVRAAGRDGYRAIEIGMDRQGAVVEERT